MLASKTKNQQIINTFKVTFAAQSNITQLIRQYIPIRASIIKLLNRPLKKTYSIDDILTICKKIPKSLQRNANMQNQLQLCKQIKQMSDNFLEPTSKHRYKTYTLYMSFQRFSEILTDKLLHGIPNNFKDIEENPQTLKLFYFTKQLEDINILLEQWAKIKFNSKSIHKSNHQKPISWVCHDTNGNKTVITQPSTVEISRNISRHQKISTLEDYNQRNSQIFYRSSTAKPGRKQAKIAIRCPSAAEVFKKSPFKQPSFELKRTLKHKSNDCLLTSKTQLKQNPNIFQTLKNNMVEISGQYLTNENETNNDSKKRDSKKYRKVSILNKSLIDQTEQIQHKIRFKPTRKINNQESNNNKSTNEPHLRKIKRPIHFHVEDQQNQEDQKLSEQDEQDQQYQEKDVETPFLAADANINKDNLQVEQLTIKRKNNWKKSTVLVHHSQSEANIPPKVNTDQSQDENQQLPIRLLEKRQKKVRRPGKLLRKSRNQISCANLINVPKKVTHVQRRRKAIIANQNEQNQLKKEIQTIQLNIQNSTNQKHLDFEEDVLLGLSEALKSTKSISKIDFQKDKKQPKKVTVNDLYGEINQFLKHYQNGVSKQPAGSVFFDQQEQARKIQDLHVRQKMQQMMNHNQNSISNIFELQCRQENNRQEVYNQIYRQLSFFSDSEWIRNTYWHRRKLAQKQI